MPATACVCRHSYTAHVLGSSKGCSFCNCQEFKDPAELQPQKKVEPLSEQAVKALDMLSANPAFRAVDPAQLKDIARLGHRRLFLADAVLMDQGEASESLHIIVKGRVKVEREVAGGDIIFLAEVGAGDIVGEMGVLRGDARTARVTAIQDLETVEIMAPQLKEVFQKDPEVLSAVMRVVNERLKTTEDKIEQSVAVALAQLGQ